MSDAQVEQVYKYFDEQNRPHIASTVYLNLHGAIPKTKVVEICDILHQRGDLSCKEYGKQKVYSVIQKESIADNNVDLIDISVEREKCANLEDKIRHASSILQKHLILNNEAVVNFDRKLMEIADYESFLSFVPYDISKPVELVAIPDDCAMAMSKYKRICRDIADSCGFSSLSDFFQDVGLE